MLDGYSARFRNLLLQLPDRRPRLQTLLLEFRDGGASRLDLTRQIFVTAPCTGDLRLEGSQFLVPGLGESVVVP